MGAQPGCAAVYAGVVAFVVVLLLGAGDLREVVAPSLARINGGGGWGGWTGQW